MTVKAAAYFRVSTADQGTDDRNSLPVQRELFEAHCAAKGYTVAATFVDVMSGARADRPQYQALLESARRKQFDRVIVSFLDRLGRDDYELMAAIGELRRYGVVVEAIRESAERFLDVALSAWKAQEERQRISERVTLTMRASASRGVALGRAPYGYVKQWDVSPSGRPINHRLVIDEERAEWVRQAFRWYVHENVSLREIARRFSESSPLKPNGSRQWFPEEIRKLLTRRRYLGEYTYGDVTIDEAHEAIIDAGLFVKAQERLAVKASMPRGRTQRSDYLLSGVLRCAHCGGPMHGSVTRARPEKSRHVSTRLYICARHYKQRTCAHANGHEAGAVEQAVIAALSELAGEIEIVEQTVANNGARDRKRLAKIIQGLERLDIRLVRNLDLFERGAIASMEQLAIANAAIESERQRLTSERSQLEQAITNEAERRESAKQLPAQVRNLKDQLGKASAPEAKALLQGLVESVELASGDPTPRVTLRLA